MPNKEYSFSQKLVGLAELGRPIEWSKSLMNMFLATMMAFYIFAASIDYSVFVLGFISVALLWASLYALNDYTDRKIDAKHKIKKNRPIPSGRVSEKTALGFVVITLVISLSISVFLSNLLLFGCLVVMLINQLLYTTKPFRFKTRKGLDFISGSIVNPIFRYFSGMVLFVSAGVIFSTITPILPLIFVIGMQFGGYSLYRLFSKKHDQKTKMKSSVALLSEKKVKTLSYAAMGLAMLSYLVLLVNGLTLQLSWLGYLPVQFFIAILVPALFAPLLKDAVLNPQKANMKKSYRAIYYMNLAFIASNIIIFLVWP